MLTALAMLVVLAAAGSAWPAPAGLGVRSGPAHPLPEPISYCVGLQGPGAAEAARRMGLDAIEYK
ncbi:MAG: hypothetical protein J7M26_10195, partial [Armatimonadetes bacterium]|nr:hypothetical protein [Armatimonadota bacterium]